MKQVNISTITLLLFFILTGSSFAQTIAPVRSSFKIDESVAIFNKETGSRVSHEEFTAIIRKNPRVHLEREINERGEVSKLIYDPNGSGREIRDIRLRPKPNQPFPEFIFKTTVNEIIDSKALRGKVIVLFFNMALKEPFVTEQFFKTFENTITNTFLEKNIVPIILTHSSLEEISTFTKIAQVPYPIVASSANFFHKFTVLNVPSYIVIKKDGTLGAYADDLDELKQALSKLN